MPFLRFFAVILSLRSSAQKYCLKKNIEELEKLNLYQLKSNKLYNCHAMALVVLRCSDTNILWGDKKHFLIDNSFNIPIIEDQVPCWSSESSTLKLCLEDI